MGRLALQDIETHCNSKTECRLLRVDRRPEIRIGDLNRTKNIGTFDLKMAVGMGPTFQSVVLGQLTIHIDLLPHSILKVNSMQLVALTCESKIGKHLKMPS